MPDEIRTWLTDRDPRAATEPLILETAGNSVLVRLLPTRREDRREVLLLEGGTTGQLTVDALRSLGLTAREAEALNWGALHRPVAQTAAEMGISPRTVEKHLQRVYAKLGVHDLAQATATAWAAVGVRRPTEKSSIQATKSARHRTSTPQFASSAQCWAHCHRGARRREWCCARSHPALAVCGPWTLARTA